MVHKLIQRMEWMEILLDALNGKNRFRTMYSMYVPLHTKHLS